MDAPFGRAHTINLYFLIMTAFVQDSLPIAERRMFSTKDVNAKLQTCFTCLHNSILRAKRNVGNVRRRQTSARAPISVCSAAHESL